MDVEVYNLKEDKKKSNCKMKKWTDVDDKLLIENYGEIRTVELAEMLGVTKQAVDRRVLKLGLKMTQEQVEKLTGKRRWTEHEDSIIAKKYGRVDTESIAKEINRSSHAVKKRAEFIGANRKITKWTDESIMYLKDNWGVVQVETMCRKFNLTPTQVRNKARKLNLGEESKANLYVLRPKDVAEITGQSIYKIEHDLDYGYLKYRYYKVKKQRYKHINVDDFLEYLKDEEHCNLSKLDISLVKPYLCKNVSNTDTDIKITLDEEFLEYLVSRMKNDKIKFENRPKKRSKPWTVSEEKELRELALSGKYTHKQLSEMYDRTLDGVRGKLRGMNLTYKGVLND